MAKKVVKPTTNSGNGSKKMKKYHAQDILTLKNWDESRLNAINFFLDHQPNFDSDTWRLEAENDRAVELKVEKIFINYTARRVADLVKEAIKEHDLKPEDVMAKMLDFLDELKEEKLNKEREARKNGTVVY